jgi:hypothetical protein
MREQLYTLLKDNSYKQLDFQSAAGESIDKKSSILIGAIFATPTLIISLGGNSISIIYPIIGFLPFVASFFFAIKSFWHRDLILPAEVGRFYRENKDLPETEIYTNFIDDCAKAIVINAELLKAKGKNFNTALILFCITLFITMLGLSEGRWLL